jgi:hypothetical protein
LLLLFSFLIFLLLHLPFLIPSVAVALVVSAASVLGFVEQSTFQHTLETYFNQSREYRPSRSIVFVASLAVALACLGSWLSIRFFYHNVQFSQMERWAVLASVAWHLGRVPPPRAIIAVPASAAGRAP